jgi:hypothetical protein
LLARLDAFKGFWQFPLDVNSQELLSDIGMFSPTRLVQGSTDAVHAFRAGTLEALLELVYQCVLIWIDDILAFDEDFKAFIGSVTNFFVGLRKFNIKLNPISIHVRFPGVREG